MSAQGVSCSPGTEKQLKIYTMMKKIFTYTLLFLLFTGLGLHATAQRTLTNGEVNYDIAISSAKGNLSSGLTGATLQVSLSPTQSRTEMVSNLGTETTVYDSRGGEGFILKEYSGQKLMITTSKSNWLDKNKWNDDLKFSTESGTSTINGYSCRKATATGADGKSITVYYTPDVTVANKTYNSNFSQLPGLPVQYEVASGNLTFTYKLKSVNFEPVPGSKFEAPRQGYRVMTYEENQQLKVKDQ